MHSQYEAARQLLAAGAFIEQMSDAPLTYRIRLGSGSTPFPGWLVQQFLAHQVIRPSCRVSGRMRFVATAV